MKEKILLLNLIAVFVAGFALTTFLHEIAHAITAKMVNTEPVLFHSYVSYDSLATPAMHQLYIAAAGPLFSLLQALIFIRLLHTKTKIDFVAFLYLWMSIIGMVVFLGYIMMGPFVSYGDTGKIYTILAVPEYISLALAATALICIIYFFRKLTLVIGHFIFQLKTETGYENKKAISLFFVFPLLIGTLINVLISLPAPTTMSLVFPIVISLTMIPSVIRVKNFILPSDSNSLSENIFLKKNYRPILLMVIMILISRILATGIEI